MIATEAALPAFLCNALFWSAQTFRVQLEGLQPMKLVLVGIDKSTMSDNTYAMRETAGTEQPANTVQSARQPQCGCEAGNNSPLTCSAALACPRYPYIGLRGFS